MIRCRDGRLRPAGSSAPRRLWKKDGFRPAAIADRRLRRRFGVLHVDDVAGGRLAAPGAARCRPLRFRPHRFHRRRKPVHPPAGCRGARLAASLDRLVGAPRFDRRMRGDGRWHGPIARGSASSAHHHRRIGLRRRAPAIGAAALAGHRPAEAVIGPDQQPRPRGIGRRPPASPTGPVPRAGDRGRRRRSRRWCRSTPSGRCRSGPVRARSSSPTTRTGSGSTLRCGTRSTCA